MESDSSALGTAKAARGGASSPIREAKNELLSLNMESACLGRVVVLRYQGPAIFRNEALALSALIFEVLPQARRMIVDLAPVRSLDSGALGELVLTHMWAEAARYELRFSSPTESIRELFESTNLIAILNVHSTLDEALESMALYELVADG